MDCFGTYFTHAQNCDNVRVQSVSGHMLDFRAFAFSRFPVFAFSRFRIFAFSRFRVFAFSRLRVFVGSQANHRFSPPFSRFRVLPAASPRPGHGFRVHRKILHCTVSTTEAYTEQFLHQKLCTHAFLHRIFFTYCTGLLHAKNFTPATLPYQKQQVFFSPKQLCDQKPIIHPHHHANHDPRMNCHCLYTKYNISDETSFKNGSATLRLSLFMAKSLHFPRRVTHQYHQTVHLPWKVNEAPTSPNTVCAFYEDRHANITQILQHSNYPSRSYSSVIYSTRSYSTLICWIAYLEFLNYKFSCCQA